MEKYTGRQIAIFSDVHALLEPLVAILEDIKRRGITEIYSLGDDIGLGPNPREVLYLLEEYGVKSIRGNGEDYSLLGVEPFSTYVRGRKIENIKWTRAQLTPEQVSKLMANKHSYDLVVGGEIIGLCHFANDVRIDFRGRDTYSFQRSINNNYKNPLKQFEYTNSPEQLEKIHSRISDLPEDRGFVSANNEPLFGGKKADFYDEIIQGHVHFKLLTENERMKIRTIRAAAMAFGEDEPVDFASYIIIKEKVKGYDVEEVLVQFDREKMMSSIEDTDLPFKDKITKFVSKKK